jgi:hypothetical protein
MAKLDSDVPQPGPARLSKGAGPDEWLEAAKECKYLPEADMKRLCEIVKECLMEGTASSVSLIGAVCEVVDGGHVQIADDMPQNPTSSPSELLSQSVETSMANSTTSSNCSASPVAYQTINLRPLTHLHLYRLRE